MAYSEGDEALHVHQDRALSGCSHGIMILAENFATFCYRPSEGSMLDFNDAAGGSWFIPTLPVITVLRALARSLPCSEIATMTYINMLYPI